MLATPQFESSLVQHAPQSRDRLVADASSDQCAISKLLRGKVNTSLDNKELVLLYFSAMWCGACERGLPAMIEFYEKLPHDCEIVYVGSDLNPGEYEMSYHRMPWASLSPEERFEPGGCSREISEKFEVQSIPTIVIVDRDANVVAPDAKSLVMHANAIDDVPGLMEALKSGDKSWEGYDVTHKATYVS